MKLLRLSQFYAPKYYYLLIIQAMVDQCTKQFEKRVEWKNLSAAQIQVTLWGDHNLNLREVTLTGYFMVLMLRYVLFYALHTSPLG